MKHIIKIATAACLVLSVTWNVFGAVNTNAASWAVEGVQKAFQSGIVPEELLMKATDAISREDFCKIAVDFYEKVTGEKAAVLHGDNPFRDTSTLEVVFAVKKDMISGIEHNMFYPDEALTREQMAAIIYNTLKSCDIEMAVNSEPVVFKDVLQDSYAFTPIQYLLEKGIVSGYEENLYQPKNKVTVQEAIIAFHHAYEAFQSGKLKRAENPTIAAPVTADSSNNTTEQQKPAVEQQKEQGLKNSPAESKTGNDEKKSVEDNRTITINGKAVRMGDNIQDLKKVWGEPDRIDKNGYNHDRYVYLNGYADLFMVTVVEDKVTEIYTGSKNFKYGTIAVGQKVDDINNLKYWDKNGNKVELATNSNDFTAFVHLDNDQLIDGIMMQDVMYESNLDKRYNQNFESSTVLELYDLINSIRVRNGQSILKVDEAVAAAATKHCFNMSKFNFIAYNDQLGKTPFDRIKDTGLNFAMAAETVGKYEGDAISIYHELISNIGKKSNLLNIGFDHIGIGVYIENYSIYATTDLYRAVQ